MLPAKPHSIHRQIQERVKKIARSLRSIGCYLVIGQGGRLFG
jgi:hypothetical protein